jgi:hypothetical protein
MKRLLLRLSVIVAVLSAVASVFFWFKVREGDALVRTFIADATRDVPRTAVEATAHAIAGEVYRRTNQVIRADDLPLYEHLESASPFHVSTAVSLRHGVYGLHDEVGVGQCGTMTRVTLEALHTLGIPARKLQLLAVPEKSIEGHTMLEFQSDGRWLVLSPSDDAFMWRTWGGRVATVEEIRSDPAIFAQVFERFPKYPYRFERPSHIRWEKLPGPVRRLFRLALGEERYENALTPPLYDRPRELFLWTSVVTFVVAALVALLIAVSAPAATRPDLTAARS